MKDNCEIEVIEVILTPQKLLDYRIFMQKNFALGLHGQLISYIEKFFDLNRLETNKPIAFQIGSVSGLIGSDLQNPKIDAIELTKELLEKAGFFAVSAENIGFGFGQGKPNPKYYIYLACRYLLLKSYIVVPVSIGTPSTGTGEEMGFADSLYLPCVGLEFDVIKNSNHFFRSSSTAGNPRRTWFKVDQYNPKHFDTLSVFFSELKKAINDKRLGLGFCPNHGKTFYIETNNGKKCFHDLAHQSGLWQNQFAWR